MIGAFIRWSEHPNSHHGMAGYVILESGCHEWVGSLDNGGYGQAMLDGRVQKVHRARYEREVGPVPEGMELDHFACDNRACCNPAHVRPVTPRENSLRSNGVSALNRAKTHCSNGHPLSGYNLKPWDLRVKGRRVSRTCYQVLDRARKKLHRAKARGDI